MYTNLEEFGGNFIDILNTEFKNASHASIATGYTSIDLINQFADDFIRIAKNGGLSRLLIGMAFYEGLNKKKYDLLMDLNSQLRSLSEKCGVFITYSQKYHGKVYHFQNDGINSLFIGSSNFSQSGTKTNIECTIPVLVQDQQKELLLFLQELYSNNNSAHINRVNILLKGTISFQKKVSRSKLEILERYDPNIIKKNKLDKLVFPLQRIAEKEKSNLNVYFGRGRWNRKTDKVLPRPWYEIELIANRMLSSNPIYPKGNFTAYTDDGFIIPMRTQGDYYKNIRSRNSLQIFGMWLKGKLQNKGVLNHFTPVTPETLIEYGKDKLILYKIDNEKYFMEF